MFVPSHTRAEGDPFPLTTDETHVNPVTIPTTATQRDPLLESLGFAVIAIDGRGEIDYLNPAGELLFGQAISDARGRALTEFLGEPHNNEIASQIRKIGKGESSALLDVPREVIGCRLDGSTFAMELTLSRVEGAEPPMLVAVARDIEERKRVEEELRHLVDHDSLTGLPNRHSFERELSRHIAYAARYGSGGSVVTSESTTSSTSTTRSATTPATSCSRRSRQLLGSRLRETDILARLSSDIFAVLLHGAGEEKAQSVAEELLERVTRQSFVIERQPIRVTMSAGVAALGGASADRPRAARGGRRRDVLGEGAGTRAGRLASRRTATTRSREKRAWSERVRQATEKGLFVLVCQPILNLEQDGITQYELLLRMRGDDGELVPARRLPRDRGALRADPGRRPLGRPAGDPADRRSPRGGPDPDLGGEPVREDDGRRELHLA